MRPEYRDCNEAQLLGVSGNWTRPGTLEPAVPTTSVGLPPTSNEAVTHCAEARNTVRQSFREHAAIKTNAPELRPGSGGHGSWCGPGQRGAGRYAPCSFPAQPLLALLACALYFCAGK
jgi:hypothetical protein